MGLKIISLLSVFFFIKTVDLNIFTRPSNGLSQCRKNLSIPALEVLPGGGWDNLRNLDMGRVMTLSYSQCQTSEDGVYIIPDEIYVVPQKMSKVEMNSEMIDSWLEQKSSTSKSINIEASFYSVVNGKFSSENQRMKTHQVADNSVMARVQVRNHLYTVKAFPDFTLDASFARQAEAIADAIENNQTRQADYLSEKMVLDYGTHVITSVDAGAVLLQEDYLKSSYVSDRKSTSISKSAGINFFNIIKFDFDSKDSKQTQETTAYQNNITYSITMSHGGGLFYQGITLQKWQESTLNNLVAIDRSGLPLHYFLNSATFPDLPLPTVNKVAKSVSQAIERYYKINIIPGCVNQDSKNFNFQANVDDASCEGPSTNLSFGGVYQMCTPLSSDGDAVCQEFSEKNPATGSFSCQPPYTSSLLRSEVIERPYNNYECHTESHSCGLFYLSTCYKQVCENVYHVRRAQIQTYWCSNTTAAPDSSGYLFGGLFGPNLRNPLTKSRSCPSNFFAVKFLSSGTMICLSNNYELGTRFSVPVGGFFSCESTNPLANNQMRCPPKFSQNLLAISDGCQVLYCVQSGIFTRGKLLPVKLPPFTRPPVVSMLATNTVAVMTQGDKVWLRIKDTNMWKAANPEDIVKLSQKIDEKSTLSIGVIAGIVIGVLIGVLLVSIIVVVLRRKRSRGFDRMQSDRQFETSMEQQMEQQSHS